MFLELGQVSQPAILTQKAYIFFFMSKCILARKNKFYEFRGDFGSFYCQTLGVLAQLALQSDTNQDSHVRCSSAAHTCSPEPATS